MNAIFLFLLLITMESGSPEKQVDKNGMQVKWKLEQSQLIVQMKAPTKGWVAIGINEQGGLKGTNLIMGNIINEHCTISDRYIVGIGNHKAVESIGGQSHLHLLSAEEVEGNTLIQFSVRMEALDDYHYHLWEGKPIKLLMAYSQEDDFEHHSIMRTSVDIIL